MVVNHANYSAAQLADVDDHYYYDVSCRSCLRSARISLTKLCSVLGGDYPVVKVVKRLKCRTWLERNHGDLPSPEPSGGEFDASFRAKTELV